MMGESVAGLLLGCAVLLAGALAAGWCLGAGAYMALRGVGVW